MYAKWFGEICKHLLRISKVPTIHFRGLDPPVPSQNLMPPLLRGVQKNWSTQGAHWLAWILFMSAQILWSCWSDTRHHFPMWFGENSSHSLIIPRVYNTERMLRLRVGQGTRHKTQSEKRYAIKGLNTCCILLGIHPNLVDSRRRSWLRQWHSGGVEDLDHRYPLNLFLN